MLGRSSPDLTSPLTVLLVSSSCSNMVDQSVNTFWITSHLQRDTNLDLEIHPWQYLCLVPVKRWILCYVSTFNGRVCTESVHPASLVRGHSEGVVHTRGVVRWSIQGVWSVWSIQECVSYEECGPYRSVSHTRSVVHTGVCLIRGVWSIQECVSYEECGPCRSVSHMRSVVHTGVCLV